MITIILFIGSLFRAIFAIIWMILIVYALLDLFRSSLPQNTKLLWLIVILLAPVIGSVIYLVWGRNQKGLNL